MKQITMNKHIIQSEISNNNGVWNKVALEVDDDAHTNLQRKDLGDIEKNYEYQLTKSKQLLIN